MSALDKFLLGKVAIPNHPATILNPNGREGFVIVDVRRDNDSLFFRGHDTMWFGENSILRFEERS